MNSTVNNINTTFLVASFTSPTTFTLVLSLSFIMNLPLASELNL